MQGLPQQQQQPEQTERERRMAQMQAMQQAAVTRQGTPVAPQQQPKPLANNYMGPPEAPVQVEPPRAGPTGFVGFGQQLAANQDVAQRMAQRAGQAALEGGGVTNLRNDAGRTALLQRAYGKAAQVTDMDAALAGTAGGDYFGQLQAEYGPEAQARRAGMASDAQTQARANAERNKQLMKDQTKAFQRAEEQRVQDEIRKQQARGSQLSNDASSTRNVTPEQWAAMHGMTLEQWVRNGKKPAY